MAFLVIGWTLSLFEEARLEGGFDFAIEVAEWETHVLLESVPTRDHRRAEKVRGLDAVNTVSVALGISVGQ